MECFFIFTLWWLELHTITTMVDCQSFLEGWLEEATLFPTEHNDYVNIDDLCNPQKNNDGLLIDQSSDLQWLEEIVKLNYPNDPNTFLPDLDYELFDDILQCNNEALTPSDDMKPEINSITVSSNPSSPVSNGSLLSPPCYESISEVSSPESYISDIAVDNSISYCLSPSSSDSGNASDDGKVTPSVVSVTICLNADVGGSEPPVPMTIEEVASSVKERRYLNAGNKGKIPKVQVTLKNSTRHPYSRAGPQKKRKSDPDERKKVQNKEAAARYRMKKRSEEKELLDEVSKLEMEQGKLQSKHDNILSEIKYLKSLMCEMLQKKGAL